MSQLSQLVLNDNSDSQLANAVEKLSKSKRYREVVDDLAAFEAKAAADIEGLCDANHRVSIYFLLLQSLRPFCRTLLAPWVSCSRSG